MRKKKKMKPKMVKSRGAEMERESIMV